jgi:hypothetical protein
MYMSIVLASVRALFRCRSKQAIVGPALRQQLATCAHQQTVPRLTPLCPELQELIQELLGYSAHDALEIGGPKRGKYASSEVYLSEVFLAVV